MIEKALEGDRETVTVWFNAWRFEQEEHPIVPLVGCPVNPGPSTRRIGRAGRYSGDP
jgi:hypothetical protein